MKKMQISASIYAIDYQNEQILRKTIKSIEDNSIDYVHFDICDGVFVKQISFDESMVCKVKKLTNLPLDIHMMVANPIAVLEKYLQTKPEFLTVHYEVFDNVKTLKNTLLKIKKTGTKSGLSISPQTTVQQIKHLLEENKTESFLDMILVMSVAPGISGQKFIEGSEQKISQIKNIDDSLIVEVDGGINAENIQLIKDVNADIVVSGSFLFSGNVGKTKNMLV